VPNVFLARTYNFQISLFLAPAAVAGSAPSGATTGGAKATLVDGAFQECSGLDIEMDVVDYLEGGRNDGVVRRVGRAKYQQLVLKRGMFYNTDGVRRAKEKVDPTLWSWLQDAVSGKRPVPRYNGYVDVLDLPNQPGSGLVAAAPVARWAFERGLPAKIVGPQLNARTGEVAIEELHIAHEGLRLVI
jgi:phage tail-like protein